MPIQFDLSEYKNPIFIETGTYNGDGVVKALESGFEQIYSIELDEERYQNCKEKFFDNDNVEILLGDSGKVLPELLKKLDKKVTFWLDAHYCGDGATLGEKWTPFREELEAINNHSNKENTIMINNWRCMNNTHIDHNTNKEVGYIGQENCLKRLKNINENFELHFENGSEICDVLICTI
tara:strand:+ start:464 stop:1003 length:540 start_codon:yes stop_codon:yes gene_type:complete